MSQRQWVWITLAVWRAITPARVSARLLYVLKTGGGSFGGKLPPSFLQHQGVW